MLPKAGGQLVLELHVTRGRGIQLVEVEPVRSVVWLRRLPMAGGSIRDAKTRCRRFVAAENAKRALPYVRPIRRVTSCS